MTLPFGFAAGASTTSFQFLVGKGPLCGLATNACPDITMADNGDMVAVTGQGTLSILANSVTGDGTFAHMAPDGTVRAMEPGQRIDRIVSGPSATPPEFPQTLVAVRH